MTETIRHALLADLPHQSRAVVRASGEDVSRFLQGLLTADVGELTPGKAIPAALLTVKGKIVSEVWVLAINEEEPFLLFPAELGPTVTKDLDDHIIMDDVELEPLPDHACMIVWAPGKALTPAEIDPLPAQVHAFEATHPLLGLLLVGPGAALEGLAQGDSVGQEANTEAFTDARIQAARPAWGHEIQVDRFPPEVGYVDAVSYDKGCYLGQEPLSRIHNRGKVNRVMVRVSFEPGSLGEGTRTLRADDKDVGELTSYTASGQGLAVLRRNYAQPGTSLDARGIRVEVQSLPLGDDPGGSGRQKAAMATLGGRR